MKKVILLSSLFISFITFFASATEIQSNSTEPISTESQNTKWCYVQAKTYVVDEKKWLNYTNTLQVYLDGNSLKVHITNSEILDVNRADKLGRDNGFDYMVIYRTYSNGIWKHYFNRSQLKWD